jgi:hypothetical protein
MRSISRVTATPVRAELVLRRAQDDRKYRQVEHKLHPVRAEPVEALPPRRWHFDKLSANGGWWADFVEPVRANCVFPIILSLSKDKLSPFDRLRMHGHFDKLSANGVWFVFPLYEKH